MSVLYSEYLSMVYIVLQNLKVSMLNESVSFTLVITQCNGNWLDAFLVRSGKDAFELVELTMLFEFDVLNWHFIYKHKASTYDFLHSPVSAEKSDFFLWVTQVSVAIRALTISLAFRVNFYNGDRSQSVCNCYASPRPCLTRDLHIRVQATSTTLRTMDTTI